MDLGFEAEGTVFLPALDVGAQLVCNGGTFANEGGMMMVLQGARVGDIFSWKEIGGGSRGHLNLEDARVNVLVDDVASWPKGEDRLILDGFEYGRLAGDAPLEAEKRLEWLERQKQDVVGFKPQPYEQLADVYDRMGHEEHARKAEEDSGQSERQRLGRTRNRLLGARVASIVGGNCAIEKKHQEEQPAEDLWVRIRHESSREGGVFQLLKTIVLETEKSTGTRRLCQGSASIRRVTAVSRT